MVTRECRTKEWDFEMTVEHSKTKRTSRVTEADPSGTTLTLGTTAMLPWSGS